MSAGAQSLYFRLHTRCDDGGAFRANQAWVRSTCYPMADHVTSEQVHAWLTELADIKVRLIEWYEVDGETYGRIVGYAPAAPSKVRLLYPKPSNEAGLQNNGDTEDRDQTMFHVEHSPQERTGTNNPKRERTGTENPERSPVQSLNENENEIINGDQRTIPTTGTAAATEAPQNGGTASGRIIQSIISDLKSGGDPDRGRRLWADTILDTLKPDREHTVSDYQDLTILALTIGRRTGTEWIARMIDALFAAKIMAEGGGGFGAWRNQMKAQYGEWRGGKLVAAGSK